MSVQSDIVRVLTHAEGQLVSRLHRAVKDREYSAAAELAAVSQSIRELIESVDGDVRVSQPAAPGGTFAGLEAGDQGRRRSTDNAQYQAGKTYPKFARNGDRLVKIGWSRKSRTEYVHRMPRSAVKTVASALCEMGAKEFSMEGLTAALSDDAMAVPSYQVYLAVAWLRARGAVRKEEPGIYVAFSERLTDIAVDEHWATLKRWRASKGGSAGD